MNMNDDLFDSLTKCIRAYSREDRSLIMRAFEFADYYHRGVKRKSGEDFIVHPLYVACILANMKADADTIAAGLLHDTIEDSMYVDKPKITDTFNSTIADLVDGVTKIKNLEFDNSKIKTKEANTRKIVESILTDIRIFNIKLADRLHNMRTLEYQTPNKQVEKSVETLSLFVPFANLLGEYDFKSELENLSFRYLYPFEYVSLKEKMDELERLNTRNIYEVKSSVSQTLNSRGISHHFKKPLNSNYQIFKLIKDESYSIEKIDNYFKIAILLNTKKDCLEVLNIIKKTFNVVPYSFEDYITKPKDNLYSSYHISVYTNNGTRIQFQIRTIEMDFVDSYGVTAYWSSKKSKDNGVDKMQSFVSNLKFYNVLKTIYESNLDDQEFNKQVDELILKKIK